MNSIIHGKEARIRIKNLMKKKNKSNSSAPILSKTQFCWHFYTQREHFKNIIQIISYKNIYLDPTASPGAGRSQINPNLLELSRASL